MWKSRANIMIIFKVLWDEKILMFDAFVSHRQSQLQDCFIFSFLLTNFFFVWWTKMYDSQTIFAVASNCANKGKNFSTQKNLCRLNFQLTGFHVDALELNLKNISTVSLTISNFWYNQKWFASEELKCEILWVYRSWTISMSSLLLSPLLCWKSWNKVRSKRNLKLICFKFQ